MKGCGLGWWSWAVLASGLVGCQSDKKPIDRTLCFVPTLSIASPLPDIELSDADDADPSTPGQQVNIGVDSDLPEGAAISISVETQGGATYVWPEQVAVDADGHADFEGVTLPSGSLTLRAHDAGCSSANAAIGLSNVGGASCEVVFSRSPRGAPHYHPVPVLNTSHDSDAASGLQTQIQLRTTPGFEVEVRVLDVMQSQERTVFKGTVDDPTTHRTVEMPEGIVGIRALCRSPFGREEAASGIQTLVVDTTPPVCSIAGDPDVELSPQDDLDPEVDGTQFDFAALVVGPDVVGEESFVTIQAGAETYSRPGGAVDTGGIAVARTMLWQKGSARLTFQVQDRAGNRCKLVQDLAYVD